MTEEGVGAMLGTIDRQHISRLIDLLADGDAAGLIAAIAEVDEQFPDYGRLLDDLARTLQRIAVYQAVGVIDQEDDVDEAQLDALASRIAAEDVQLFYQIALLGRRDLQLAPDPRSGAEMTLLRMLTFQPEDTVAGEGSSGNPRKQSPRASGNKVPVAASAKKSTRDSAPAPAAATANWRDPDWAQLVGLLQISGFSKQLASNCAYLRREGDTVFLSLDGRSESYLTRPRQAALAEALSGHFGEQLKVDIAVGAVAAETPVQQEARKESENLDAARAGLEADPNIKTLKDMFGAEIVADSVEPINSNSANQE